MSQASKVANPRAATMGTAKMAGDPIKFPTVFESKAVGSTVVVLACRNVVLLDSNNAGVVERVVKGGGNAWRDDDVQRGSCVTASAPPGVTLTDPVTRTKARLDPTTRHERRKSFKIVMVFNWISVKMKKRWIGSDETRDSQFQVCSLATCSCVSVSVSDYRIYL
jgi:hypothetical protein